MILGVAFASIAAVIWFGVLLAPWRPWSTHERIEPVIPDAGLDLSGITVLIPARNEADVIGTTLAGLEAQGGGLKILLVDDQSDDGTAEIALSYPSVEVLIGQPLPAGWAGKLWALDQGLRKVTTAQVLLLDADIELRPGLLAALVSHKHLYGTQFVSLMAHLAMTSAWDRMLLPAFVYFFKLIYPFSVSNSRSTWVAAAAGGCILVDTSVLREVGAFESLRGALIDDCTLARRVKDAGYRTWIGLSRGVISLRPYGTYESISSMVSRSAFTQLRYSTSLLLAVTLALAAAFWLPLAMLIAGPPLAHLLAGLALAAMLLCYAPILAYYRCAPVWAFALPLTATLYLAMTWGSAISYWRGVRSRWKGRTYERHADAPATPVFDDNISQ